MTRSRPDPGDGLRDTVEQRRRRREAWHREGERSLGENLAMIGSLGWLVVTPTLLGLYVGRRVDRAYDTGILWTAGLLLAGLIMGCLLAWNRVKQA